ncbi:PAS domain-containing sensor histidine kinase [Halomontanus rarus]|uniref:PAS domain-containing sensor histidine kinase n=1 Tax=Halomontanus rarus TaxID=3034020 RepID=UPI0023E8B9BF|nr:PAS domain-containing sensor histidine kinase [Halovivax sp. TS33]
MPSRGALTTAGFDALPTQIALLDETGAIVYTNRAWETFGRENDRFDAREDVGSNYLAVCNASDDDHAVAAAEGIRSVIDGDADEFTREYPCHSPDERRWFTMRVAPFECEGERFVLVMHTNITERRLAEERVRSQADRMSEFARLLSHDLRNPLSVALAQTKTLAGDGSSATDSETAHTHDELEIETLLSSLERMETILEDGLVLVSAETDSVDVAQLQTVALDTLGTEAWSHVETTHATLSIDESVAIRADPNLVSHLFENLFRNAVEHGSTSRAKSDDIAEHQETPITSLTIRVGPLEDGFYVEDDGPGIPPENRTQVFESGYTTADTGSGFGLAIVEQVVAAHGWSIAVTDGRNGGARFEVTDVRVVPTRSKVTERRQDRDTD